MLRNRLLAEERRMAKAKARAANIADKEESPVDDENSATPAAVVRNFYFS